MKNRSGPDAKSGNGFLAADGSIQSDLWGGEIGEVVASVPDYVPASLTVDWTNLQDRDMVTVRKKIVLELDPDTRMPNDPVEEAWYNKVFKVRVQLWDKDTQQPTEDVPVNVIWRKKVPGLFRRPALIVEPAPCLSEESEACPFEAVVPQYFPGKAYYVSIWLGDHSYERIFHTIPPWAPGYRITEFVVEPEDCERCFPLPVRVHVFIPPEYYSLDPDIDNTSIPWDNSNQRYPVIVGLHTYGGEGLTLADTFGWATLPRFTSQGVLEPTLLVLPDGTVPEPYCQGGWNFPGVSAKTCYTQFMGIPRSPVPNFIELTSYSYFMTHTMRKALAKRFRIRGMDDNGNKLDDDGNPIDESLPPDQTLNRDFYRRAWGITGCSGGGSGTPINTFLFPEDYGGMVALIGAWPSMFNPWAYYGHSGITWEQICNWDSNPDYPLEPVGDGYRDLSMIDPATMKPCPEGYLCTRPKGYCVPAEECEGTCDSDPCPSTGVNRDITIDQRSIPEGAQACFLLSPPPVSNAIVLSLLCGLDTTCRADPDAPPEWKTDFEKYPFDGNLMFTTGIFDAEGPPAGFMDLDQQLDKAGVLHSFRYEDRGAVYHSWTAVHDYVEGWPIIPSDDGAEVPGNFPNTGIVYPFFNNQFEALGNYPFNHPFDSSFTTGALDPDRDYRIDCIYEQNPALNYIDDNCPGVYNPDQKDSDGDGVGDACE